MRRLTVTLLLLPLLACSKQGDSRRIAPVLSRAATEAATFVVLSDRDTMAVERYQRVPGHLRGSLVYGDGTRVEYDAVVAADESITHLELRLWSAGAPLDSRPAQQSVNELRGPGRDSLVRIDREGDGASRVYRARVPAGAQPYLLPSVGLAQQALRRARVLGGDSVRLPIVVLNGAASPQRVAVRWLAGDSVQIGLGGIRVRVGLDEAGRVLSGSNAALGITVQRLDGPEEAAP